MTDQPSAGPNNHHSTDQPTDGHQGSKGSYSSNDQLVETSNTDAFRLVGYDRIEEQFMYQADKEILYGQVG